MTVFNILVTGDDIARQMQPFHQYECTGIKDQYVVEVDITDELRAEYQRSTSLHLQESEGVTINPCDSKGFYLPQFKHPEGGKQRGLLVPEGYQQIRVATSSLMDFPAYVAWINTAARVTPEGRVLKWTNPNYKWDSWDMWPDFFLLKNGRRRSQASKDEIDFDGMRNQAETQARQLWQDVQRMTQGRAWVCYGAVSAVAPDDAMGVWRRQPTVQVIQDARDRRIQTQSIDNFLLSEEEFATLARRRALSPYALLHDGCWQDRGEMMDLTFQQKADRATWDKHVSNLLDNLPDSTMLSMVGGHV